MKNLELIFNSWKEIEQNYLNSGMQDSRTEFIERMLAYSNGECNLARLKALAKADNASFSEEENHKFVILFRTLERADIRLREVRKHGVKIDNLYDFVWDANINLKEGFVFDIENFNAVESIDFCTASQLLDQGFLMSVVTRTQDGKILSIQVDPNDPDYLCFETTNEVQTWLTEMNDLHALSKTDNYEFFDKVYAYFIYVLNKDTIEFPLIFLNHRLYIRRGLSIQCGSKKFILKEEQEINLHNFQYATLSGVNKVCNINLWVKKVNSTLGEYFVIFV